jgi:hypothetical protein
MCAIVDVVYRLAHESTALWINADPGACTYVCMYIDSVYIDSYTEATVTRESRTARALKNVRMVE